MLECECRGPSLAVVVFEPTKRRSPARRGPHGAARQDRKLLDPREIDRRTTTLFGPNVLEDFQASAWLGTVIKHPAHVYVARFDESIVGLISSTEPDLTKWLHVKAPHLPKDICLFNSSADSPTLVSVTHEKLFWIIAAQKPKLASETNLPAEKLFWQGKDLPSLGTNE